MLIFQERILSITDTHLSQLNFTSLCLVNQNINATEFKGVITGEYFKNRNLFPTESFENCMLQNLNHNNEKIFLIYF